MISEVAVEMCLTCDLETCVGAESELCPIHDIYLVEQSKAKNREYCKRYREKHKEKLNQYFREYYIRNKHEIREYQRKYYSAHREEILRKQKKYYQKKKIGGGY